MMNQLEFVQKLVDDKKAQIEAEKARFEKEFYDAKERCKLLSYRIEYIINLHNAIKEADKLGIVYANAFECHLNGNWRVSVVKGALRIRREDEYVDFNEYGLAIDYDMSDEELLVFMRRLVEEFDFVEEQYYAYTNKVFAGTGIEENVKW